MACTDPTPRVFLTANAKKPHVDEAFDRIAALLDSRGLLVGSDIDWQLDVINASRPDFVVALGGDGTILNVAHAMGHRQVPVIGVNLGKLGYLADFNTEEMEQHLDQILKDPGLISRRMMLDVRATLPSGETHEGTVLNDCVLRVGPPFRTIGLTVAVDDQQITTLMGDGLIIATPTGSTAHNMSCGGPIVNPDVEAILLTPKCPHSLTHHPIVVGPDVCLAICVFPDSEGASMVIDGRFVCPVPGETQIRVSRSSAIFQLVRNPRRSAWDTLMRRLKWGQNLTQHEQA